MVRGRIISLSVGAGAVAVVAGVLVWQGLLPGMRPHNAPPPPPLPVAEVPPPLPPVPAPAPQSGGEKPAAEKPAAPQEAAVTPPQKPAATPKAAPVVPQFDTVRVEPSGDTVVAGHGAPKAKIDLLNANTVLGDAAADLGGDFVIVPQPLAPGTYVLALRSTVADEPPVFSQQTITVSVPEKGHKGLVVALTEPGKPSKILLDPTADQPAASPAAAPPPPKAEAAPAASPPNPAPAEPAPPKPAIAAKGEAAVAPPPVTEPKLKVAIKTAELDKGAFYVAGFAPPGTHVRIYLNDAALADVTADAKGDWSLTIGKGMTPGHYVVRADALDAKGDVIARAEVPFDVPVAVAAADAPNAKPAAPAADASNGGAADTKAKGAGENASAAKPPAGSGKSAEGSGDSGQGAAKPAEGSDKSADSGNADQSAAKPAAAAASESHAVVPEISTAMVSSGDSLWRISRKTFGRGIRYTLIYQANAKQIRDPNLIYPGQVFVLPRTN